MTLSELAEKEYAERNVEFIPLYPAVLVRVLPKRLVSDSGVIISLASNKDKPNYEGIVLRTWLDRTVIRNGKTYRLTCPVKPGDHVMFPHWSGEPISGLDSEDYRLVPARDYFSTVGAQDAGEIYLILENHTKTVRQQLYVLLDEFMLDDAMSTEAGVNKLLSQFEIIRKIKTSVTT